MLAEMRRSDRALGEEEIHQLLEKCLFGVVSTVTTDGQPYGVPISYGYDGNRIVLHCARDVGQKLENIAAEPRVCFTVVGDVVTLPGKFSTTYESAIVIGKARCLKTGKKRRPLCICLSTSTAMTSKSVGLNTSMAPSIKLPFWKYLSTKSLEKRVDSDHSDGFLKEHARLEHI